MKETFSVSGMTCSACVSHVEKAVKRLEGVETVQVNLLTRSMQVEYDAGRLTSGEICAAVHDAGYEARSNAAPASPARLISYAAAYLFWYELRPSYSPWVGGLATMNGGTSQRSAPRRRGFAAGQAKKAKGEPSP